MAVEPIPDGYHTITPYMLVENVAEFLDFLAKAFGAEETERMTLPDGSVAHAEAKIGDSRVMNGRCAG